MVEQVGKHRGGAGRGGHKVRHVAAGAGKDIVGAQRRGGGTSVGGTYQAERRGAKRAGQGGACGGDPSKGTAGTGRTPLGSGYSTLSFLVVYGTGHARA